MVANAVAAIRRFNRLYTRQIGLLEEGHLQSPFSHTEVRVLYELANNDDVTAADLARELTLDAGYLSRILTGFEKRRLVERTPSPRDARQSLVSLTEKGRSIWADLDARATERVEGLVALLPEPTQQELVRAMQTIETVLVRDSEPRVPYMLRPHRAGDMGYIVYRQAELYAQEYGWGHEYEALILRVVANFLDKFDAARERCWIAERDGATVGSVFVVKHPDREGVARLRLLYVEPAARGLGIGRRLVRECTEFARQAGYHTLTLWTNDVLISARRIYEAEGYELVHEEPHGLFGKNLHGQTWELRLVR